MVSLGQKLKMSKTCEKPYYKNIRIVLCKKPPEKHQIFEKWENFETRPSCKAYSPCRGYRLCRMANLGQKFKIPKKWKKPFYKNIKVVVCRKPLEKNTKCSRNERILKIGHLAKLLQNGHLSQKPKMPITCEKPFYKRIRDVVCKKNIRKNTKHSRNETILKIEYFYLSRTLSNKGSLRPRWFIHVWSLYRGLYFGWVLLAWYITVSAPRVFMVWNSSNVIVPVKSFKI